MLCFETALRLFYWSRFAYACTPVSALRQSFFMRTQVALLIFCVELSSSSSPPCGLPMPPLMALCRHEAPGMHIHGYAA